MTNFVIIYSYERIKNFNVLKAGLSRKGIPDKTFTKKLSIERTYCRVIFEKSQYPN
jgi:hypothetical protein